MKSTTNMFRRLTVVTADDASCVIRTSIKVWSPRQGSSSGGRRLFATTTQWRPESGAASDHPCEDDQTQCDDDKPTVSFPNRKIYPSLEAGSPYAGVLPWTLMPEEEWCAGGTCQDPSSIEGLSDHAPHQLEKLEKGKEKHDAPKERSSSNKGNVRRKSNEKGKRLDHRIANAAETPASAEHLTATTMYFLLGRDASHTPYAGQWSDFGAEPDGQKKQGEDSIVTAVQRCYRQSFGLLGHVFEIDDEVVRRTHCSALPYSSEPQDANDQAITMLKPFYSAYTYAMLVQPDRILPLRFARVLATRDEILRCLVKSPIDADDTNGQTPNKDYFAKDAAAWVSLHEITRVIDAQLAGVYHDAFVLRHDFMIRLLYHLQSL